MRSTTDKGQTEPGVPRAPQRTTEEGARPQSSERGRDPLLGAICHDLRAPLAAVTMGANFVLSTIPEGDDNAARSRRVLQAVLRSCKQMERLVRDFGDLSEIESGNVVLRIAEHDAHELLALAAEGGRTAATARKVTLSIVEHDGGAQAKPQGQPQPQPLHVRCDRDRMLRALGHLIDNAIRFSPEGGSVELAVRERAGEVSFTVTDHGPGIKPETLDHLYDRTWHARRPDRSGSGLGLAIVRGVVEAHRGRIEVDTKPGATTFTVIIPANLEQI